jgi:hypothetical protein
MPLKPPTILLMPPYHVVLQSNFPMALVEHWQHISSHETYEKFSPEEIRLGWQLLRQTAFASE